MTTELSNTPALDAQRKSLFSAAGDLGAAEASGKDAKANLALLVCRGAYDGVIDDKDTSDIYARYSPSAPCTSTLRAASRRTSQS
jgi:hypothetical protein